MRSIAFSVFSAGAPLGAALGSTTGAVVTQLSQFVFSLSSRESDLLLAD